MKVLLLSSRFPWPPDTGDRLRATIWIEALDGAADVTLVSPPGRVPPGACLRHLPLRPSPSRLMTGAMAAARRRLPLQTLAAAPYHWGAAMREAGEFDAAIVLLARSEPWIRDCIPARRVIVDAVDALSSSARERGKAGSPLLRWMWNREAALMSRLEQSIAGRYDGIVVVSEEERLCFGSRAVAIPNGVTITQAAPAAERPYDFAFWGNLGYFANSDAAGLIVRTIWPMIRRQLPGATLLLAGARAPSAVRRLHGRDGITVVSPFEERAALLRSARIALLPLRFGSGISNKVLEAAEASCAIAGTPTAFRGLADLASGQVVETDPRLLARRCADLLASGAAGAAGEVARGNVASHDRRAVEERLRRLVLSPP